MQDGSRLGRFVAARREALGLSQMAVARRMAAVREHRDEDDMLDAIGRYQAFISRLERGVTAGLPDPETLTALATALDTSEAELLRHAGYLRTVEEPGEPLDQVAVYTAVMRNVDLLELPPALKRHIRDTIEVVRHMAERERQT